MFLLIKIRKGLNFLPSKISIHLMFLLILTRCQLQNETENYFNTSHVSINRLFQNSKETFPGISIHLMFLLIPDINQFKPSQATYFNTSHVSINRISKPFRKCLIRISIHLMFLLIAAESDACGAEYNFNTSHVSINRKSTR